MGSWGLEGGVLLGSIDCNCAMLEIYWMMKKENKGSLQG